MPSRIGTTRILSQVVSGNPSAVNRLMPLVYGELHALARAYFRRESPAHTLQPTALLHEAYLKLINQGPADWKGRTHFLAVGARAMRQILVDYARSKGRGKRWAGGIRLELTEGLAASRQRGEDLLALDEALKKLAEKDPRKAQIVGLRFFGGLTVEEVAEVVGSSKRTVEQEWTFIRAWLRRELSQQQAR